ncbi:STAS domain-containing protein [Streptomyces sp. NPDC002454]
MTQPPLCLTTIDTADTVRMEITGDLDYDTADLLLDEVTRELSARPGLKELHLHCAAIGAVDSMGLSILLMIGRQAAAAGVLLHLDDRPATLNRLLDITGTLDYFTVTPPSGAATHPPTTTEEAQAARAPVARPGGPDSAV